MKLCPGHRGIVWVRIGNIQNTMGFSQPRPKGIKRKRLPCPECGRRLMSSVELNHDGDYIIHSIPPHKPKMWWKKGKRRKVRR